MAECMSSCQTARVYASKTTRKLNTRPPLRYSELIGTAAEAVETYIHSAHLSRWAVILCVVSQAHLGTRPVPVAESPAGFGGALLFHRSRTPSNKPDKLSRHVNRSYLLTLSDLSPTRGRKLSRSARSLICRVAKHGHRIMRHLSVRWY